MSAELRTLLHRVGLAAVALACAAAMLAVVSFALDLASSSEARASSPPPLSSEAPRAVSPLSSDAPRPGSPPPAVLTVVPTASRTASPTPNPSPSPSLVAERYTNGGHVYAGLRVPAGTVIVAPFAGVVTVATYQLVDGEVRDGSNFSDRPFFPYVMVSDERREVRYRPGALSTNVALTVETGARVTAGAPLFRVTGEGPSSWNTFYDRSATYQIVVSLFALPGREDLDVFTLFATR